MVQNNVSGEAPEPIAHLTVIEEKAFRIAVRLRDFTGVELVEALVADEEPPEVTLSPEQQAKMACDATVKFMLGRFAVSKTDRYQWVDVWWTPDGDEQERRFGIKVKSRKNAAGSFAANPRVVGTRSSHESMTSQADNAALSKNASEMHADPHKVVNNEPVARPLSKEQRKRRRKKAAHERRVQEAKELGLPPPPNPLNRRRGRGKRSPASYEDEPVASQDHEPDFSGDD